MGLYVNTHFLRNLINKLMIIDRINIIENYNSFVYNIYFALLFVCYKQVLLFTVTLIYLWTIIMNIMQRNILK